MPDKTVIDMDIGEDGVYEPISEAKRRRAERIRNSRERKRKDEPVPQTQEPVRTVSGFNPISRPRTNPPVTFLEGFEEGLRIVAGARRRFEEYIMDIIEED